MASMQKSREERAQPAADDAARQGHQDRGGGSILGSVKERARSIVGAFVSGGGRADDTTHDPSTSEGKQAKAEETAEVAGGAEPEPEEEEEDVLLRVKAADHMTGQAFNDVGPMGGEGTGMPRRPYAAAEVGGAEEEPEEDVLLRVKAADHMTGQAFNDVGPMGGEGTGMPRRRR